MKLFWRQLHPVDRSGVVVLGLIVVIFVVVLVNHFSLQWTGRDLCRFLEDWWFVAVGFLTYGLALVFLVTRQRRRAQRY